MSSQTPAPIAPAGDPPQLLEEPAATPPAMVTLPAEELERLMARASALAVLSRAAVLISALVVSGAVLIALAAILLD